MKHLAFGDSKEFCCYGTPCERPVVMAALPFVLEAVTGYVAYFADSQSLVALVGAVRPNAGKVFLALCRDFS